MMRLAAVVAVAVLLSFVPEVGAQPAPSPTDLAGRVEALERQLAGLTAAAAEQGTASAAVGELATRVAALQQAIDGLGRGQQSHAELVRRGDELEARLARAEAQVNALAGRLGDVERPAAASAAIAAGPRGLAFRSDDGRRALSLGVLLQPRLAASVAHDFESLDVIGFRLRRARLLVAGRAGDRVGFAIVPELGDGAVALLDGYADVDLVPGMAIRVGQDKVPFTRQWMTDGAELQFVERPAGLDNLRYGRDLGAWLRGTLLDDRLAYVAGASNGGGENRRNDNIDLVVAARLDAALLGERVAGYGDRGRSERPAVQVGLGVVHDLVRLPDNVAGIELGERDVNDDGVDDNVRVLSLSADAAVRWRGAELAVEGWLRHERWGKILDHSANDDLADAVEPHDGRRNYAGGAAELTYVPACGWLLVGARVAHSRLSLLGVSGRPVAQVPIGDRLLELDLAANLLEDGDRTLGVAYTLFDYGSSRGPDPENDHAHRFIVEYQLQL